MGPRPEATPITHARRSEEQDGRNPRVCPLKDQTSYVTGKEMTVGLERI